ncbi:MAG: CehA/McbA family metallohydrolase [Anaerolineaceae bacterium]|jgi:hypothetical protein
MDYAEIILAAHMHTIYSDGQGKHADLAKAALKAGVDVIIITDHNVWVQEMEGYLQEGRRRVLTLVGEEIHDRTLQPGANHLIAIGHNKELSRFAPDPQQLIDQIEQAGGMSFIAHPNDPSLPRFNERSFSWHNWEVKGFSGIELWNQMSEFKTRSQTLPKAVLHALAPHFMTKGPLEETLKLWDDLQIRSVNPIIALAGVDAHGNTYTFGPIKVELYPYQFQFRSLRNHLLVPSPLTGEINADRRMVLDALRAGHFFLAYDLPHSTEGFRFTANTREGSFIMGDQVQASDGLTLQVRLPMRTHTRLLKDGKVIQEQYDREVLTHLTKEPGVYRVEVYIDYLGRHRAWIFSNPIYAH